MTKTPIAVLGIDLGKNSCSLAGLDASGAVVLRRRMTREGSIKFVARAAGMRRCDGSMLWRALPGPDASPPQGHTVRLMSPEYVRPT